MPTIKDIARLAGVSHGTVSNVLNKTGKVSTEKIHLVEEAARKLGYVPNTQAQRLRQGISLTIALILPTLKKDTYLALYTALLSGFSGTEYTISLHITEDIENREVQLLNTLPHADLAAVVTVSCLSHRYEELYSQLSCPVLFIDRNLCKNPVRTGPLSVLIFLGQGRLLVKTLRPRKYSAPLIFHLPAVLMMIFRFIWDYPRSWSKKRFPSTGTALTEIYVFQRHFPYYLKVLCRTL